MLNDMPETDIEEAFYLSWLEAQVSLAGLVINSHYTNGVSLYRLAYFLGMTPYSRKLRAGMIVGWFVLSRSREHGLRSGQHSLRIYWQDEFRVTYHDGIFESDLRIDIPPDQEIGVVKALKKWLDRLLEEPID